MKLNRNNADINNILDKKVAVICDTEEKELDFRKWAKQYVDNVCTEISYITKNIALNLEDVGVRFAGINWYIESNYEIYEWEIAENTKETEPLKVYTIRSLLDNEGKVYKSIYGANKDSKYKFENGEIKFYKENDNEWTYSYISLNESLRMRFIEYKPELPRTTFEVALKAMETKVCRSMFSNRCITIDGSQFVDASNGEYTKLALPEIKGEWVVIEE